MNSENKPHYSGDYIVFGAPLIGDDEIAEVVDSLRSGWIGTGPKVTRFEKDFARYKQVAEERVTAVGSCTAALQLSMETAGLERGSEVVVPALTFCASANAVIHAGLTPVLADVDPVSWNLTRETIEAVLTERTRAIIVVHLAGRPCDMDEIMRLADERGVLIIEDCAHAIETVYRGKPAGTIGSFGCFSFYVTKNVTTGEGGLVISGKAETAARIKNLALHGMSKDAWRRYSDEGYKHYLVEECGYKCNMTDIQAAIGIHQLAKVEISYRRREAIWERYESAFKDLGCGLPAPVEAETRHGRHLFQLELQKGNKIQRDEFMLRLHDAGIGTGVHYLSLGEHPFYQREYDWEPGKTPVAQDLGRHLVSLPLSSNLSNDEVDWIIHIVQAVLR